MKKILHITPEIGSVSSGGIGTVSNQLYENKTQDDYFIFCNIWYQNLPINELRKLIPSDIDITTLLTLKQKITEYSPDVIVFHTMYLGRYYIENTKLETKNNIWTILHNNAFLERSFINTVFGTGSSYELIFSLYNINLITVSDYEKKILEDQLINRPSQMQIKRIYNGMKFDDNFLFIDAAEPIYGYMGRLEERKGIFQLCKQFSTINRKLLLATGDSLDLPYLTTMLNMSSYNNSNIIQLGWCVGERYNSFINEINALIIPSLYEPFGMVFLEAANKMINIIAHKTPTSIEILGEDYPLFFNIEDEISLKATILKFESMIMEEKKNLAIKTKERLSSLFSIEKMIFDYRSL